MDIEFDPVKDAVNRDKHGVSLAFGERIWEDPTVLVFPTIRVEDGERRFRAVGMIGRQMWTAGHTYRGSVIRMISVRRSNDGEQRSMIAIPADPNDPEDGDVTVDAMEQALAERRKRLRGLQRAPTKQQVTLRLDPDVIAKFRATGKGWQARINAALKAATV